MDTTTDQRQSFAINDLVLIKNKRKYLLYVLEGIERDVTFTLPSTERRIVVSKLYVFKPVLNKRGEKSKNYKRRRMPADWVEHIPRDPERELYAIKLEDYVEKKEEETGRLKKVFTDYYTKLNAATNATTSRRSNNAEVW